MFKNALVYRITQWPQPALAELEERLAGARFVECGATQLETMGCVEPRGEKHAALVESVAGQWILKLCTERKAVPASAVKTRLEELSDKIEAETGRRPKGKRAKELKEQIVHELLPRAFPKRSTTWVWIDPAALRITIGASSAKKGDAIVTWLVELFRGEIALQLVQTGRSPAVVMAEWLSSQQAPAGFTIDRECELKQPDSEKASVKYARHTLEIDEVGEHIRQGKLPTQLAMSWNERVSFVLTDSLTLKRIKLLDGAAEALDQKDQGFDADVAIATGELGPLIGDLMEALGGEPVEAA